MIRDFGIYYCYMVLQIFIVTVHGLFLQNKIKKAITVTNTFQKILGESNLKPNKVWVDKGGDLYNRSMKSRLQDNDIHMYSIHNEVESVVAEIFIRTLKSKIYKHMTSISRNVYTNKINYRIQFMNTTNTYHITIKIKLVAEKSSRYIELGIENSYKDPKS